MFSRVVDMFHLVNATHIAAARTAHIPPLHGAHDHLSRHTRCTRSHSATRRPHTAKSGVSRPRALCDPPAADIHGAPAAPPPRTADPHPKAARSPVGGCGAGV